MIALKIDNRLFFLQFLHALHGKIFFGKGIAQQHNFVDALILHGDAKYH